MGLDIELIWYVLESYLVVVTAEVNSLPLIRVGGVGSVGFVRHSTGTVVTQRSGAVLEHVSVK